MLGSYLTNSRRVLRDIIYSLLDEGVKSPSCDGEYRARTYLKEGTGYPWAGQNIAKPFPCLLVYCSSLAWSATWGGPLEMPAETTTTLVCLFTCLHLFHHDTCPTTTILTPIQGNFLLYENTSHFDTSQLGLETKFKLT